MKLETAKRNLKELRAQQRNLRKQIDRLRDFIRDAGEDPDAPEVDLIPRNKEMYRQWKAVRALHRLQEILAGRQQLYIQFALELRRYLKRRAIIIMSIKTC